MIKHIFSILLLLILSLVCLFEFNTVCFLFLIILIIFLFIKLKNKRIIFFLSYFILIIACLFTLKDNKVPSRFINHEFSVEKVKTNYYIIKDSHHKYLIYKDNYELQEGNIVLIDGEFQEINDQGIPYIFNFKKYCKYQRIKGQIKITKLTIKDDGVTLRHKIINATLKNIPISRDKVSLIIYGINEEGVNDLYQTLLNLSLIHLFVISGFHFQFLYKSIKKILKKDLIIFILLFFYLYLLNYSISALRAFLFLIVKKLDKKKKLNGVSLLSLIAISFIVVNPYVIFNTSFILSFTLSFFIELIKVCEKSISKAKRKYMWMILPYLSVLPVVVSLQGQMSVLQMFIQIFVTPFIPILYFLSFLVILIPKIDYYYFHLIEGMEIILNSIDSKMKYIDFMMINDTLIIFYYLVLLLFYKNLYLRRKKKALLIIYCLCLTFLGYNIYPYNEPAIYFLDVGQGDSALIRGKNNSYNILIDTGGLLYQDIALKRQIPLFKKLGIKKIDLVFISHSDYDHNGALKSLQDNFNVVKVIEDPCFKPYRIYDLLIYNLNPYVDPSFDENSRSQILYFKFLNKYFLFCGDMSKQNEEIFIDTYTKIKVDFLKVAHHGSNTSSSDEFLDFIDPSYAIISVGKNNKYGHPSNEVLDNLISRNIKIYRTDQMGSIIVTQNIFKELKIYKTILN